jgi:hypothetical protein
MADDSANGIWKHLKALEGTRCDSINIIDVDGQLMIKKVND